MNRLIQSAAHLSLIILLSVLPLSAQGIISSVPAANQNAAGSHAPAGSPRSVTLDVRAVPLGDVLQQIQQQSGVKLIYGGNVVPLTRKVTLKADNAAVESVLRSALAGVPVTLRPVSAMQIGIVPVASAKVSRTKGAGVISGRVSDAKTSKPISGASVSFGAMSDRGVTTGDDGVYRLTGVTNGNHTVTVRIIGYAKQTRQVTVAEGATVNVDFKLEPSASVLDQVIVTGSVAQVERRAVPTAMTVINAKQIEERGITRIDQLFRGDIPGLFAFEVNDGVPSNDSRFGATAMFVRGSSRTAAGNPTNPSAYPLKTFVNGIELSDATFLNTVDPKSIERIEIITGPQASTLYGSGAISGVMQIFTKKGARNNDRQLTVSLQSGGVQKAISSGVAPIHDHSIQLGGGAQEFSYNVGGGYQFLGQWMPSLISRTYSGYGSIRRTEGMVTAEASARMSDRQNNGGTGADGRVDRYIGVEQGVWNWSTHTIPSKFNHTVSTRTIGLVVNAELRPWWQQRLTVGRDESVTDRSRRGSAYTIPSDTLLQMIKTTNQKITANYSTTLSGPISNSLRGTLTAGADHMGYESNTVNGQFGSLIGTLTSPFVPSLSRGEEMNRGYFAQGQLALMDALFLTAGLRREDNENSGKNYKGGWFPRYGASFARELGPLTAKLRAAYGSATRTPPAGRGSVVFGGTTATGAAFPVGYMTEIANPELRSEQQRGPEVGMELYLGNRASLQLTYYKQTVKDLVMGVRVDSTRSVQPDAVVDCGTPKEDGYCYASQLQYQNVGSLRNTGWESQGELTLPWNLLLGGSWSYSKSRIKNVEPGYICGAALSGRTIDCVYLGSSFVNIPEHTGALRFSYSDSKTNLSLHSSFIGQRRFSNDIRASEFAFVRLRVYSPTAVGRGGGYGLPGYYRLNMHGTRSIWKHTQLMLRVTNLLGSTKGESFSGYDQYAVMGRKTETGLVWRF